MWDEEEPTTPSVGTPFLSPSPLSPVSLSLFLVVSPVSLLFFSCFSLVLAREAEDSEVVTFSSPLNSMMRESAARAEKEEAEDGDRDVGRVTHSGWIDH